MRCASVCGLPLQFPRPRGCVPPSLQPPALHSPQKPSLLPDLPVAASPALPSQLACRRLSGPFSPVSFSLSISHLIALYCRVPSVLWTAFSWLATTIVGKLISFSLSVSLKLSLSHGPTFSPWLCLFHFPDQLILCLAGCTIAGRYCVCSSHLVIVAFAGPPCDCVYRPPASSESIISVFPIEFGILFKC